MEYAEDDYLMLSGIQHFKFCRRTDSKIAMKDLGTEIVMKFALTNKSN